MDKEATDEKLKAVTVAASKEQFIKLCEEVIAEAHNVKKSKILGWNHQT